VLATSYAPELRRTARRPKEYPRTDYVELAKLLDCDILDYSIYDDSPRALWAYRGFEKRLRLDLHLALSGFQRAKDYDVVMLMSERVAIPYMMLQRMLGRQCATVLVSAHSSEKQARLVRALNLFRDADIVVSNTHAQCSFLVKRMLVPESSIRYVLYAVDEQFFVPGSGEDYILSAGGIAGRDYPTLFEAVRELPATIKIAASGRLYGPDARRSLPPVPPNVEFLPPTDSAGMRERYQGAAAVVVPLHGERQDAAGCSVVLEAMCCGKPVIATHTQGMEDYVHENRTGRLVGPGDVRALRESLVFLQDQVATGKQWGMNARLDCENRLSLGNLVVGLKDAALGAYGH
jgi:glycosyltransferase involved in cell wall biosynthesis